MTQQFAEVLKLPFLGQSPYVWRKIAPQCCEVVSCFIHCLHDVMNIHTITIIKNRSIPFAVQLI